MVLNFTLPPVRLDICTASWERSQLLSRVSDRLAASWSFSSVPPCNMLVESIFETREAM